MMRAPVRRLIGGLLVCAAMTLAAGAPAADAPRQRSVPLGDGAEVGVRVFPARGRELIVWLSSEGSQAATDEQIAEQLARTGIEVWLADVINARFLPELRSSLDEIPGADVAAVIAAAAASGKRVYLLSAGRGALPVLRGARTWQLDRPRDKALAGAILLWPSLYVATPEPGADAEYLPVVRETRLPIYILQPQLSPWYWRLERLTAELRKAGSVVQTKVLPGVRDRFYFRSEHTVVEGPAREDELAGEFSGMVREAVTQLNPKPEKVR
jgi:hypothetical protein